MTENMVLVDKAMKGVPDPTVETPSNQRQDIGLSRNRFTGWWPLLQQYGMLKTSITRAIGNQGIPGNCSATLRHMMAGMEWQVKTVEGESTVETEYYELLLKNARDAQATVIGASGLFDLLADDMFNACQGGNVEIVRFEGGKYDGVPIALYSMDAAQLKWIGGNKPIGQFLDKQSQPVATFEAKNVMHLAWNKYTDARLTWYNRHPVQMAWTAINCLAAADDYNYSLLTEVIPQGILNLGMKFDKEKAMAWKDAWHAAKKGQKLDDIALLWGTEKVNFVRFQEQMKEAPFQHMSYWYLTICTGAYEMSPLDLGFMTQLNTKAGAEVTVELTQNKGLRRLTTEISKGVEFWILPDELRLVWPDIDPSNELAESQTRETNVKAISAARAGGWMEREEARSEARRLAVFELDPKLDTLPEEEEVDDGTGTQESGEEEGAEEEEEAEVAKAEVSNGSVGKNHTANVIDALCPLGCPGTQAFQYEGHGSWLVCATCGKSWNPIAYRS